MDVLKIESSTLSTRSRARELVERANQVGCEAIDLGKVEFMSRSFTDELLCLREQEKIELINMSDSLSKMVEVVGNSRDAVDPQKA